MRKTIAFVTFVMLVGFCTAAWAGAPFTGEWKYVSETSAVIYWRLGDIKEAAHSYVEYGKGQALGKRTPLSKEARWAQFHRITGLETGAPYMYRMVNVDPVTKKETRSAVKGFTLAPKADVIRIPGELQGPPYVLDKPGATYLLTQDMEADGHAIIIEGAGVTVDLDGHTVTFGNNLPGKQAFGVYIKADGKGTVCNGHIVQGKNCGKYSSCVESRWRPKPAEVFGISTDVHLNCGYPIRFFGAAMDVEIHHNHLYSRNTELESRHYPGNHLARIDIKGGNIRVHNNLLTEGCHGAFRLSGEGPNVEISYNDIRHHQQYVNGYAFSAGCAGMDIHHNKVTSSGRGVHLSAPNLKFHDNHLDTYGHQQLSDLPAKSRPFKHQMVELHGIKFEGRRVKNAKVYNNFMRITQKQPVDSQGEGSPWDKVHNGVFVRSKATAMTEDRLTDDTQNWEKNRWRDYWVKYDRHRPAVLIAGNDRNSLSANFATNTPGEYTIYQKWNYVPATPLNVGCYDPNGMNEVYGNTFVALTTYERTRHGGYGRSGQWASAIYLVGMTHGPADEGKYAITIHDNTFISNDLFASTGSRRGVTSTVRIERNKFILAKDPKPTATHAPFRRLGKQLEEKIKAGNNTFEGMQP